jgi:dienelactone hydrolase
MPNNSTTIGSGAAAVNAEVFTPATLSNGAAVVIAYGSDGMTDPWAQMIRDYAAEFARRNFTVVIPDYLARTGTTPGFAVFGQIAASREAWQSVVEETVVYARTLPGVAPTRIGLLGFSLGGHLCLRVRHTAKLLVEFFAPEFPEIGGIGASIPAVSQAQIHHGLADELVPFSNAESIQNQLTSEGTASELFRYESAGHGFVGRDPHNRTAALSAQKRTLEFFTQSL